MERCGCSPFQLIDIDLLFYKLACEKGREGRGKQRDRAADGEGIYRRQVPVQLGQSDGHPTLSNLFVQRNLLVFARHGNDARIAIPSGRKRCLAHIRDDALRPLPPHLFPNHDSPVLSSRHDCRC